MPAPDTLPASAASVTPHRPRLQRLPEWQQLGPWLAEQPLPPKASDVAVAPWGPLRPGCG